MVQTNINSILLKTLSSIDYSIKIKLPTIIEEFQNKINETFNYLEEANNIDISKNNGFKINKETINNICNLVLKEPYSYGDITLSTKDEKKNITYGKQITSIGTVCTIFDGNSYTLIELLLRNILSNNPSLYIYSGYMYGTNTYIIELLKEILTKNNINNNLINQYITEDYKEVLSKYTSIDLVIGIGPRELQNKVASLSNNKTLLSGYNNYEIYIDSIRHIDFLEQIMSKGYKISLYAKSSLGILNTDITMVDDEDEAISMINNTGSKFSTAIFTDDNEIASKFLEEVKSKQVLVNTSPTIESFLDIKQSDLYIEKTIIYPVSNKTDGTRLELPIK